MWAVMSVAIIFILVIGFILGRLRPKICARAVRRAFRGLPKSKSTYQVPRANALSYLVEIEKQEIDVRKTAFQQMTTVNAAGLAVSGGLILKQMIMFHWLALIFYVLALIFSYIGTWSLADGRQKRFKDVLSSVARSSGEQIDMSRKNIGTPINVKFTMFFTYLFFVAGVGFTTYAFFAKNYCDDLPIMQMNAGERFICDLVISSDYLAAKE